MLININGLALRKRQQSTVVGASDTRLIAAGNDPAGGIHNIDVAVNDVHGAFDNFLRQIGMKGINSSHVSCLEKNGSD